jgi:hypothetical protein
MLTSAQIADIYTELNEMTVLVHQQPQLGFTYYADFIAAARIKQERLGDLTILVNRHRAEVRVKLRCVRELKQLDPTNELVREFAALENEFDELRYLADSLDVKSKLVRNSMFDVRLLLQIMESQLKLGEVQPPSEEPIAGASVEEETRAHEHIATSGTSESARMADEFLTSEPMPYRGPRPH